MVSVYDPLGTPTVVYTRSGRTIIPITPGVSASPGVFADAVEIPKVSGDTIVLANVSGQTYSNLYFSSSYEVGDIVAIVAVGVSSLTLFDSGGTNIGSSGTYSQWLLTTSDWIQIR